MQILLACLGLWVVYNLWETNEDRLTSERAFRELLPQGEEALTSKKKLFSLVQDLSQTAGKDPSAAQVLNEFKIQLQAAPGGNAPSTTK
jgi:hypothetical protein